MRDPFFRPFSPSPRDSWLQRIRENFRQAFSPARIFPSSANGAPLHLDPPTPPKRLPGPIPATPASLFLRVIGGLLLLGLAAGILFLLFAKR